MNHSIKTLWIALAAASVVAGCGGKDLPGMDEEKGPAIGFSSPENNEEIMSSSVWVDVGVREFTLSPENIGGAAVDGQGHYHFYVDGLAVGEAATPRFLVTDLEPGLHEVSARLFGNDHQPVPGAAPAIVTVLIPAEAPRVKILSPGQGATVNSSSVELQIETQNYNSGRWHAYVNTLEGEPTGIGSDPTNVVTRVPAGRHEVFVRLHHSDGSPFEPEIIDRLQVSIPDTAPRIQIVSPSENSETTRSPTIQVQATNFTIDGNAAGGENQDGVGHLHVYVDGYDSGHMWQEGYASTITLNQIPTGTRDVYVRLMNNDHTSIEPKIVDRIRLNVTGP